MQRSTGVMLCVLIGACAAVGTRPDDMSVAEHEAAAQRQETVADAHARRYDPDAESDLTTCGEFCFLTWTNPTSEHAIEARRHRRLADRHRDASQELREAEREACATIPERDRDISPFFHYRDIVGVTVDDEDDDVPSEYTVRFRAVPGVDENNMQQLVDCHLARNAARGHVAPDMPYCPLVPRGVEADVDAEGGELEIHIDVDDPQSREEVWTRMQRLMDHTRDRRQADRR